MEYLCRFTSLATRPISPHPSRKVTCPFRSVRGSAGYEKERWRGGYGDRMQRSENEELTPCNGVCECHKLCGHEILDNVIIIRSIFVTISLDFISV